jgi:hypothetical protein
MAIADVPTSLGSSFFIKTFLPGFIASILGSYAAMPIIACSFWASLTVASKLILWTISAMVIGMMITSLDLYHLIFISTNFLKEYVFGQNQYGGGNIRGF